MNYKSGDKIFVLVNGNPYETYIDDYGVQRFKTNTVINHLFYSHQLDLNRLEIDYQSGKFTKEDYMHFYMSLGYSVCGFRELSSFEDVEIINPLWLD